jgi:ketosteroid isomerase-like protein
MLIATLKEAPMKQTVRVMALSLMALSAATLSLAGPPDPASVVQDYHAALVAGDRDAALGTLSEDLILFEDGVAETLKEYASSHLKGDIKFSATAKRELIKRETIEGDDTASVCSLYRVEGRIGSRKVKVDSAETMILKQMNDGWKIVHIHWSNRRLR